MLYKSIKKISLLILIHCFSIVCHAQIEKPRQLTSKINPTLLEKKWNAKWIASSEASGTDYGVYLFRKTCSLSIKPKEFIVHVSADNKYRLYVNEKYVGNGPASSDLLHWNFESIDIAPYLEKGENIISAVVWNFGNHKALAQISSETGFILQGNSELENSINTNSSWQVFKNTAYTPLNMKPRDVGPGERFNASVHPWYWNKIDFDTSNWKNAKELENGIPNNSLVDWGKLAQHILEPRKIPAMEEKRQRFAQIRRSNLPNIPKEFINGKTPLTIPANSKVNILLDQGQLTNAYPVINFSKGKGGDMILTYAESLINDNSEKGNRNTIENKHIEGKYDIIEADGGENRVFQTLWWRSFRYLEIQIRTKNEPLIINDFHNIFTAYPFEEKATFNSNDPSLKDIWNVGWHTQRLCAYDIYMDCPYYEQLQYVGDARIQALVSSYVSGDSRLMRKAISSIHDSYLSIGLTQSRYPTRQAQIIPPFSLIWATMVYDYWMLNQDDVFIKSMIPRVIEIMNWYQSKMEKNGLLGNMGWWNFVDWVDYTNWDKGIPPDVEGGNSAIITLQYVYTLQKVATLLKGVDYNDLSSQYSNLEEDIRKNLYKNCYDSHNGLIADTPEKNNFSQHANALAILTNTLPINSQKDVMLKVLQGKNMAQCSFYFSFYVTEAMDKVGLGNKYIETLTPWKQMLDLGLTTFAEKPELTRSDCHAWSASPVYYFLSTVCGIKPNEAGFNSVKIEPHLGNLKFVKGSMPHKLGTIVVNLKKYKKDGIQGVVILPENLTGTFTWYGKNISLNGGENRIEIK